MVYCWMGVKGILGKLPLTGLCYSASDAIDDLLDGEESIRSTFFKPLFHAIYTSGFFMYLLLAAESHSLNPTEQIRIKLQQTETRQIERKRYDELYNKLFGVDGYANRDKSRGINFDERVDALRRMGFDGVYIEGGTNFPQPTLEKLERAVRSYEVEQH